MVNRINEIVNGCAAVKPIFDATDAEAHKAAKGNPIIQNKAGLNFVSFILHFWHPDLNYQG